MGDKEYDYKFKQGDVFTGDRGTIEVESVGQFGAYLTVTDPTVNHPQDARAGRWKVKRELLEDDLDAERMERTTLEVSAQ